MEKKNIARDEYEIDLAELLRIFWKNKIIIVFSIIFFALLGYFYSLDFDKSKEFQSKVTVKLPSKVFFLDYAQFVSHTNYEKTFNSNILSLDNLVSFYEQNDNIENFKVYLKKNNIPAKNYFLNKFGRLTYGKTNEFRSEYYLYYDERLDGNDFLNDYINFVKKLSLEQVVEEGKSLIKADIINYENNLKIAEKLNLNNSLLKRMSDNNSSTALFYEPEELFYKGKIVLEHEIKNLKNLLNNIDNNKFDHNPILDSAIIVSSSSKDHRIYPFLGMIFGFCLSLVFIFFRQLLKVR